MNEWEPCFVCGLDVAEGASVAVMVRTGAPEWVRQKVCQFCASKIRSAGQALVYVRDEWFSIRVVSPRSS